MVATIVNMMLLNESAEVGANEGKDDGFWPNCGRELIQIPTEGRYCPYCGYLEKRSKEAK